MPSRINAQEEAAKGKQRSTEVLEVEDEEQRHERMRESSGDSSKPQQRTNGDLDDLLARINASAPSGSPQPPQPLDFGDRSTFPVTPPLECAFD